MYKKIIKPNWFNPKDYEVCKDYKGIDWLNQLEARNWILSLNLAAKNSTMHIAKVFIEDRFEFSFPLHVKTEYLARIGYHEDNYLSKINLGIIQKGVSEVICPELGIGIEIEIKTLKVDLNEKDCDLREGFSKWLKVKRESDKIKAQPPINSTTFLNWNKWNLLGMYDLAIWAKIKGFNYGKHGEYKLIDFFAMLHPDDPDHFEYYGKQAMREIGKISNKNIIEKLYKEILFNNL